MPPQKPKRREPFSSVLSHEALIRDRIRTLAYKKAIERNVRRNDIVADIGCGTGILSFFAALKGCRKVYAVDKAGIIDCAEETARRNGLHHNIEFVRQDILKFEPQERIDILIHEQIGNFLWDEDAVSKVAYMRDNFLRETGRIIPVRIDLYLAPTSYQSQIEKSMSFWSKKQYGIDFGNLPRRLFVQNVRWFLAPSQIELHDRQTFLCDEKMVHTIDFRTASRVPREISASFKLGRNSRLTGMCAYFTVHLDERTRFSTRPAKTNTHWGQIFLPCPEIKKIRRDSCLNFTLWPATRQARWRTRFDLCAL